MLAFALAVALAPPESLTADEIMTRVAENQERAQEARARYVYRQDVIGRMVRGNGKIAREEKRVYTVTPTADGTTKEMTSLTGRYLKSGQYNEYTEKDFHYKGLDIDCDLLNDLLDDLVEDKDSKDGVDKDLFPLRKEKIEKYVFTLKDTKPYKGRLVYRIAFRPKDKSDFDWKGEALIDAEEFEPVSIATNLSRNLPTAVKVLLGTDIKQLGYAIDYQRVAPRVWFPVSYGTEFHLKAVFFYSRTVTMSVKSSDFKATEVESKINYTDK